MPASSSATNLTEQCQGGSMPLDLRIAAPTGPVKREISDLAAAGSVLVDPMPTAKTISLLRSPGSGPTTCTPGTEANSEAWATPISASPLATISPASAPGTTTAFDFI